MGFCGAFFGAFSCAFFVLLLVLFLVLVLRFPLESPSENWPEAREPAGVSASSASSALAPAGPGASWPGRAGWGLPASRLACKQPRPQGQTRQWLPSFRTLGSSTRPTNGRFLGEAASSVLTAPLPACFGFRSLSDQDVRTWC